MISKLKTFTSYFLIAISIISCNESGNEQADTLEVKYPDEITRIISYITAGSILPQDQIKVTFIDDVVGQEELNTPIKNPFDFSPSIEGKAVWKEKDVLVFTPDEPMGSRTNYTGKLDIKSLSETFNEDKIPNADMKFYVLGRELTSFNADLELSNPNNPNELVYRGKVSFTQVARLEMIQDAATFASFKLNWNQESEKSFSFVSETINRGGGDQRYTFEMNGKALDLPESFEKTIEVTPLEKMKLGSVEKNESGKQPKLQLKFSDNLDIDQDLDGFVNIEPHLELKLQKLGKYLILDGNFKFGNEYKIKLSTGIRSRWGTKTEEVIEKSVRFADIAPKVEFGSNGMIMPTSNDKRLQFLTTNLKRVHVEIKKVFDKNLDDFFRDETLNNSRGRGGEFNNSYISSVGSIIYNQTLEIGDKKNEWLLHEINLDKVFSEFNNGVYLIRLNFNPNDVLVPIVGDQLTYIQKQGQIYKPLTISDIGLIAKKHSSNMFEIYATDLKTGAPMRKVNVTMTQGYRNSKTSGYTNDDGIVALRGENYTYSTLIKGELNGQVSVIKAREMEWSSSGFDVGGLSAYDLDTRAYIYTERGVYRPGDSVNVSCIVRHKNGKGSNAPGYFKLYNPEGTLIHELTQKNVKDGFYNFHFGTGQSAPTGNWSIRFEVGNKHFYHTLKVETVVANRLKVKVTPSLKTVLPENKKVDLEVIGKYLFGADASGLAYESEVEVFDVRPSFAKYKDFTFFNSYVEFQDIKSKISKGQLDEQGLANLIWNVPVLTQAPSPLKAKISVSVSEEGGRPNNAWAYVDVHPFTHYVGIGSDRSYVKLNERHEIPVVVVDHKGEATAGRDLVYKIYKNDSYWWYQYDGYRDFRMKFKSDKHSLLVEEGVVSSVKGVSAIPFQPVQKGQYLIEVQDGSYKGHTTSLFVSAYPYGGAPTGDENAGTLTLRAEKDTYEVGEKAIITFPSPKKGNILFTVEQGDKILMRKWITPESNKEDMRVGLDISSSMAPNVYVTVTAIQEHGQTINDRPLRMFGILPINVIDPATKGNLVIHMPDELLPKQSFDIDISTLNGEQTQFTVAVVDEGLLDLTNFKTPNPWTHFFKKIRLEVSTFDLFAQVIGANKSGVFKSFSIGGDEDYRESQLDPFEKKKRFKPVCMFQGPLLTDRNGKARVSFEMPNYVGSVRVMVVATKGNTYASEEKAVPVRSDLIIQPTIPRALKPGDEFDIPVNVFATKENIGEVNISINTEGPVEIVGQKSFKHVFNTLDDQMFYFKARVKQAIGQARIEVFGKSQSTQSMFEADVPVTASALREYQQQEKIVKPGETVSINLPKTGIDGTNNARLNISVFPNMDFFHRLHYLIQYPYGCIEQTTSSVFPQLALKSMFKGDDKQLSEIDKNINAGIDRLRLFQLPNGGFSYWPGGREASPWGSNYAGQFLIEARKNGYAVPEGMYHGFISYLKRETRKGVGTKRYEMMIRLNRCYVLALAGEAPMKEMNVIMQNEFEKLDNVQKWQLVTAYKLAGAEDKVQHVLNDISTEAETYSEFAGTYGSQNRDLGIILRCLVLLEKDEDAALLAKNIAKILSGRSWYSTQTVSQMLLGMASYFDYAGIVAQNDLILEGQVLLPNGEKEIIKHVDKYALYINEGYGEALELTINESVDVPQLYVTLSSNGVPMVSQAKEENKNINMEVTWYNEDGEKIDITAIQQGNTFYGHYRITNSSVIPEIEEMALVQLLPSGWEIENTRLSNEIMPAWMADWKVGNEEYLDIRDDRIMWFFDLRRSMPLDFVVKLNAISTGNYQLPGARCEAMYNNDYVATKEALSVKVLKGD